MPNDFYDDHTLGNDMEGGLIRPSQKPPPKPKAKKAPIDRLEKRFLGMWHSYDLLAEYRFTKGGPKFHYWKSGLYITRKWRFDFVVVGTRIAIELHGSSFGKAKGGHTSGAGFNGDREKFNAAVSLGWKVIELPEKLIASPSVDLIMGMAKDEYSQDLAAQQLYSKGVWDKIIRFNKEGAITE